MNNTALRNDANIPQRHRGFIPSDSTSEKWTEDYATLKALIDDRGVCALLGKRGGGKTQMAACAIGYVCENGRKALYTKAFDVFLSIRGGVKTDGGEIGAVATYLKPFLLVIDAFEVSANSDFEKRTLDHIIDRRYDQLKPTVIISNETREDFAKSIGESNIDRMKDGGGGILFDGDSFRGASCVQ